MFRLPGSIRHGGSMARGLLSNSLVSTNVVKISATSALGGVEQRRNMGLLDRLKNMAESKTAEVKEKKKDEIFKSQLEFLTNSPTYGLPDHVNLLSSLADKAGVNGWRTMFLSDLQKNELADQLIDLKIGSAFTPAEQANPRLITGREKLRVATEVGTDVTRVNRFMDGFSQSVMIHKWLQGRKTKGQALPSTMEEYVACMLADRVGNTHANQKKNLGKSRSSRSALRKA